MRNKIILAACAVLVLAPALVAAQSLTASLAGSTSGDSDGTGFAVLNVTGSTLDYAILVQNIASPTAAHVHKTSDDSVAVDLAVSFVGNMATGQVTVPSATATAMLSNPAAYYVNVHNAEFPGGAVRGTLMSTSEQTIIVIPVIAKLAGQADTNFVSDLTIGNAGNDEIAVAAEWYPTGATLSGPAKVANVSVPAKGQKFVADAVASLFGVSNTRGGLVLRSAAPFEAQVRTYNDQRANPDPDRQGTFGQFVDGLDMAKAMTSGVLYGLSNRPVADARDYRTNIGWFNPTATAVNVTFAAYKADGSLLGQVSATAAAYGNDIKGVFDLINQVTEKTQQDFFVTYQSGAGIFVFGTVNDNKTGDGIHIASKRVM